MCGITGMISFTEEGKKFLSRTSAATYALLHRGPDGEGLFLGENYAFGHRRLKILDLSDNASQPMTDDSGNFILVFNGEIFNYKELKEEFLKDFPFKSTSDTEVLLHLLIKQGQACLDKLDGEFAFAFFDKKENKLLLARDPGGVKPLYFVHNKDVFAFASELRALAAYDLTDGISPTSLQFYLHLGYIPDPGTFYSCILSLRKGTYLTVNGPGTELKPYTKTAPKLNGDHAQKVKSLFERSVERRLISDVPVGCFLSGGIDSSIITGITSSLQNNIRTFSIGFPDSPEHDESKYAEEVAKHFKTSHTTFAITEKELLENLPSFLDAMDQPFADSSALAFYILSKKTVEHVKVVLSGDGADELFGGYNKHTAEQKARSLGIFKMLSPVALPFASLAYAFSGSRSGYNMVKFLRSANKSPRERYWDWAGVVNAPRELTSVDKYFYDDLREDACALVSSSMESILENDQALVLTNDMLVKADRFSMANSLEVRVPFLSRELVNYVNTIPADLRISPKGTKWILREAFKTLLPASCLMRPKHGFEVPLLQWFHGPLEDKIRNECLNPKAWSDSSLINVSALPKIEKKLFSSRPGNIAATAWALLVLHHYLTRNFSA